MRAKCVQGSSDDKAWVALARAEVLAWERDPAVGHEHLQRACDAYRRSIDALEPGFVQVADAFVCVPTASLCNRH